MTIYVIKYVGNGLGLATYLCEDNVWDISLDASFKLKTFDSISAAESFLREWLKSHPNYNLGHFRIIQCKTSFQPTAEINLDID